MRRERRHDILRSPLRLVPLVRLEIMETTRYTKESFPLPHYALFPPTSAYFPPFFAAMAIFERLRTRFFKCDSRAFFFSFRRVYPPHMILFLHCVYALGWSACPSATTRLSIEKVILDFSLGKGSLLNPQFSWVLAILFTLLRTYTSSFNEVFVTILLLS